MPEPVQALFYQIGVDTGPLLKGAQDALGIIRDLSDKASDTFEKGFGTNLAKSIDFKNLGPELAKAKKLLD